MLDRLHAVNRMAPLAACQTLATGWLLWTRTSMVWVLAWCALSLLLLGGRILLAQAYRQCSEDDDPELWAWRFTYGAWAASFLWGSIGFLILLVRDPVVHFIVIAAQTSNLCAVVTRNNCEPRAAFGQVCFIEIPTVIACWVTLEPTYVVWGVCALVEIIVARATIRFLCHQTVSLLCANEEIATSRDELERANLQLERLATTDALTGMGNRRGFDAALRREWRRGLREQRPVSLLLLDLDHFKMLNDTLGHPAGDACLRQVAAGIQTAIRRPADVATRYGGEEFAVVLPDTDLVAARHMAERVRLAISALRIYHPASPTGLLTVSVGAATALPDPVTVAAVLVQHADAELYRAKVAGRDRVSVREVTFASPAVLPVEDAVRVLATGS